MFSATMPRPTAKLIVRGLICLLLGNAGAIAQPSSIVSPLPELKRFHLFPGKLPRPAAMEELVPRRLSSELVPHFVLPPGFAISVFAAHAGHARYLAVAPNGDLFVASSNKGEILLLRDEKGIGKATLTTTFASGFSLPHGLAFRAGAVYVADMRGIWRLPYRDGDLQAQGPPTRVTAAADLRPQGLHWSREIAFDPKGRLYLAIGSRSDVDNDPLPDASIQLVDKNGGMTTFATGLRNVVGLAIRPGTDELWGTVNERDGLGPDLPPDFLARIDRNDFFGWPNAYIGPHPDPIFGGERPDLITRTKTPDVLFEAHSAPLGLVFYDGQQFPAQYQGDAFVALHGSGPYHNPDAYKIVRVPFTKGKPMGGYEDFVTGWMVPGTNPPEIFGAPVGLAVAKDGSLLVSDEISVWRVAYVSASGR